MAASGSFGVVGLLGDLRLLLGEIGLRCIGIAFANSRSLAASAAFWLPSEPSASCLGGGGRVGVLLQGGLIGDLLPLQFGQGLLQRLLGVIEFLAASLASLAAGLASFFSSFFLAASMFLVLSPIFSAAFGAALSISLAISLAFGVKFACSFASSLLLAASAFGLVRRSFVGLLGDALFLLGQFAELLVGILQLGDVVTTLVDLGGLVGQLIAGLLQGIQRLVLLGDRFGRLLGIEVLGGILHRLGRLVEGLSHLVLIGQRRVLDGRRSFSPVPFACPPTPAA